MSNPASLPSLDDFHPRVHALSSTGHPRAALDLVLQTTDDLLREGQWARCDALLEGVVLEGLDPMVAVGFLTATCVASGRLPAYSRLYARVAPWLRAQIGAERAEGLLRARAPREVKTLSAPTLDRCRFCGTTYCGDARVSLASGLDQFYRVKETEQIYRYARCICTRGQLADSLELVPVAVAWGTYYFIATWETTERSYSLVVEMIPTGATADPVEWVVLKGPDVLVEFSLETGQCRGRPAAARGRRPKLQGALSFSSEELELLRRTTSRKRFLHLPASACQQPLTRKLPS